MRNGCKRTTAWILLIASLFQNCNQCVNPPIPQPTFEFSAQLDKSEVTLEEGKDTTPVKLTVNITSTNDLAKSLGYKCTIRLGENPKDPKSPKGSLSYLDPTKNFQPATFHIYQKVQEGEHTFLYTPKNAGTHPIKVIINIDDKGDSNNVLEKDHQLSLQVHQPDDASSGSSGGSWTHVGGSTSKPTAGSSTTSAPATGGGGTHGSGGSGHPAPKAKGKAKAKEERKRAEEAANQASEEAEALTKQAAARIQAIVREKKLMKEQQKKQPERNKQKKRKLQQKQELKKPRKTQPKN